MYKRTSIFGLQIESESKLAHIAGSDSVQASSVLEKFAGLEISSPHGTDTPRRFLQMLDELTACKDGSDEHLTDCIKWKDFPSECDEMIIVEAIPFVSVCNHHVIPFRGEAHIAYVPDKRMAGLSKFGRVVQHFGRRLQVQERLTAQIAGFLMDTLDPKGVGVIVRAEHMCMTIRGLRAPGTYTTTNVMWGVFKDHTRTAKAEFLSFVNGNGRH